jgi:hypothetical protein
MSESTQQGNGSAGGGGGAGCVIAAAIAGGLALLVSLGAVVLLVLAVRTTSVGEPGTTVNDAPAPVPPSAPVPQPPAPTASAQPCTVKLTGLGDGGTWYMIDQDIYEGDEALAEAMRELLAEAKGAGKRLVVSFEVQPDAGITDAHVSGAAKTCRAAGAEVLESRSGGGAPSGGGAGEGGE